MLKSYIITGWKPLLCQIEECDGDGTSEAVKVCLDHAVCLSTCPDNPPPLYLCIDCAEDIKREHSTVEFFDILMPMPQVSATCENKVSSLFLSNTYYSVTIWWKRHF